MSNYYPLITRGSMSMLLLDRDVDRSDLDLADIADALALTIQSELGDRCWVLHIVPDNSSAPPLGKPPSEIRVPSGADVELFVHDALVQFCDGWGIAFDQILIEAGAFDPTGQYNAELWAAMAGLPCPATVDYMFADAEAWDNLPATLGVLPVVKVQPVVLLGPMPEIDVLRNLLIELSTILTSSNPGQKMQQFIQQNIQQHRLRKWLRRWIAVVSQVYSSTRLRPPAWPIDAVRLRFEGNPTAPAVTPTQTTVDSFGRWGRAVTQRRVGVALGGAGAQSYVCIPFLEQLEDAGVPIDILSGSSTGAFVAAFYSALGDRGLLRLLLNSNTLGWGVFFALVDNIPLTWWLAWGTSFVDFTDLPQPTIAVASSSDEGEATHLTSGLAGKNLMASGSQPPFVPTYIGNDRLLDGGLTEDVPTAVLLSAGAVLVLAAQAIPKLMAIPHLPNSVPVPYWLKAAASLNPYWRGLDYYRGYIMLFRQAAVSQEQYAQVFYNATTKFSSAGTWFAGPRIAAEAADSQALKDAVAESKAAWLDLLESPPGRVRVNLATGGVDIGVGVDMGFALDLTGSPRLSDDAQQVIADVGAFVAANASALAVVLVDPPAIPTTPSYEDLVTAASGLAAAQLQFSTSTTASPVETVIRLSIVP